MSSNPSFPLLQVQLITRRCQKIRVKCIVKTKTKLSIIWHPECLVDWDYCCSWHWTLGIRVWVILSVGSKKKWLCSIALALFLSTLQSARMLASLDGRMRDGSFLLSDTFSTDELAGNFLLTTGIQILLSCVAIWKLVSAGAIYCRSTCIQNVHK